MYIYIYIYVLAAYFKSDIPTITYTTLIYSTQVRHYKQPDAAIKRDNMLSLPGSLL